MTGLLIHSVSEFSDLILEALRLADARDIVEIGAEYGGMSALLAGYDIKASGVTLDRFCGGGITSVNLAASYDLTDQARLSARVTNLFDEEYSETWGYAAPGREAWLGIETRW